jgi:VWFA-related protein
MAGWAQQTPAAAGSVQQTPVAEHKDGRIQLDVVVTDKSGKPVTGLESKEFSLLDNNQPAQLASFEAIGGGAQKVTPPVEAIVVLDVVNEEHRQVEYERQEVARFLRQNGGHLAVPTSVFLLTDTGVKVQPRPTMDGNALAADVDKLDLSWRILALRTGGVGAIERFQLSVRMLTGIVKTEERKPDRKLLIWMGQGWPLLNGVAFKSSDKSQKAYFASIVELSTIMREARMSLYSISADWLLYKDYLKGVTSAQKAEAGNLSLKVLVTQSGGNTASTGTDMVDPINRILAEANAYYRISFDPPHAAHPDEYHDLKVVVDQPGLTARTRTGYYAEP